MARAPATQEIETFPEADRLEGAPHPRMTEALFGHAEAERELAAALASGRMHHAWLLAGPRGIGKATLAYRFAAHALARPDERDPLAASLQIDAGSVAARQVRALSHPGLLLIRRAYDPQRKRLAQSITVDEVRRIKSFLGHRGAEGAWRVVIVDEVDELNVSAANALLKSLEEPPERTVFLLVTAAPGRLIPTIRSRCRRLDLAPLAQADLQCAVRQALAAEGASEPDEAEWRSLVRLADGSVGRALGLHAGGGIALSERIERILAELPRVDWPAAHALADELAAPQAEGRLELFFELLLDLLARIVRQAAGGQGGTEERALAARLVAPDRLASFAELWETVAREKAETLALNLDRKALVLATVARLETAARAGLAA